MKIIAGLSVFIAATSVFAKTDVIQDKSAFDGNSYNTKGLHGTADFYKTFAHDSANTAQDFIGLNNANLFYNAKLGANTNVQINAHYGPVTVVEPGSHPFKNVQLAEAFVTYRTNNTQFKVGNFFSSFASFNPYRADKSLVEEKLTNLNNNSAEVAYLINPNSYVKVWAVKPNIDDFKNYYGAKVGYKFKTGAAKVAADVSLLNDAREIFEAQPETTFNKHNVYNTQVAVTYGPVVVTGKMLRAPKLIADQAETPVIKGVSLTYDTAFSGHKAKILGEYEKVKNLASGAYKRVAFFVTTPVEKNLDLIAGVSERSFKQDDRKLRTTVLGLQTNF